MHSSDVSQLIGQDFLLGLNLSLRAQVLQVTAATNAEMRTGRRNPVRAGLDNFGQTPAVVVPAPVEIVEPHLLARQRPFDKYRFTVQVRHAAPVVVEGFHRGRRGDIVSFSVRS